jgi:hypothetical protein
MSIESELAIAALDMLHGARGLPSKQAAAVLRDFLNSISSPIPKIAWLKHRAPCNIWSVNSKRKDQPPTTIGSQPLRQCLA